MTDRPLPPHRSDSMMTALPVLDRLLPVWILLAMAGGLLLGRSVPGLAPVLDSVQVQDTSVPVAIGLLAMMYPVLARVRYEQIGRVLADRRMLGLSIVLNWVIGPLVMFVLAWSFLPHEPAFRTGLIVIGLARCIAMVLVWNDLALGDREAGAVLVAINSLFQVAAYALMGALYLVLLPEWLGLPAQQVDFSMVDIARSVLVFLGVPLALGYATRRIGVSRYGRTRYDDVIGPRLAPIALWGLLFTIVLLFALQGDAIAEDPTAVVRIAIPLLLYFAIMWGSSIALARALGFGYARAATIAFTAAGNNFELAIAVAVATWGLTSGEALAGVVGPLVEVPALVGLVYVSLWLKRRWTWSADPA